MGKKGVDLGDSDDANAALNPVVELASEDLCGVASRKSITDAERTYARAPGITFTKGHSPRARNEPFLARYLA